MDSKNLPENWNHELETNIFIIDKQHKTLLHQINDFSKAIEEGKDQEKLVSIIIFLETYIVEHFEVEERWMLKHQYPEMEEHKAMHRQFINSFFELKEKTLTSESNTKGLSLEIERHLTEWFVNHIQKADHHFAQFLKQKP